MTDPTPSQDRPWLMRTYSGYASAAESNRLYRDNLEKGQTGLSIAFDLPTQTGYDSDHVLTISIHESGVYFFPGTGFEDEVGTGRGAGYTVNVPLIAHTDDALYMKAFDEVAYPLIAAFDPDILVTQLGADTFRTDPLTRLEITTHSYAYIMRKLRALRIPWVAVSGGGYDHLNVARAWTLAWGVMNGVELPPRLPDSFVATLAELGYPHRMLLDAMHWAAEDDRNRALDAVEKSIAAIRATVFPILIGHYGAASG